MRDDPDVTGHDGFAPVGGTAQQPLGGSEAVVAGDVVVVAHRSHRKL